jgi:hypothetical protein
LSDIESLKRLVIASSLSYLPLPAEGNDDDDENNNKNKKTMIESPYYNEQQLRPLKQVIDPISKAGATIFEMQDEGLPRTIVVACRGSANWDNFITNLKFQLVPVEKELLMLDDTEKNNQKYKIHTGFQAASIGLWKVLQPELYNELLQQSKSQQGPIELIFTGHSLGSATALLCAVQYTTYQKQLSDVITPTVSSIITFGGPRLVNEELASYWMTNCFSAGTSTTKIVNFIHSRDPILQQNQLLWDALQFSIVGNEVVCEPTQPTIYPTQSKLDTSVVAINFYDHCQYLGIFVGPRLLYHDDIKKYLFLFKKRGKM